MESGRAFYKMSGSGNDFVMIDARTQPATELHDPSRIAAICSRGTGVGADGIVFLEPAERALAKLVYLNSDGSEAALCGNATLCTARMLEELGAVASEEDFTIETGSGAITARINSAGQPEIDFQPVQSVRPSLPEIELVSGEERIGFGVAGVPHLVVLRDEVETLDVLGRGRHLRFHRAVGAPGANVNFIAPRHDQPGTFWVRTYERGVEGETLACGTGAVATAVLLATWGLTPGPAILWTRSGRALRVRAAAGRAMTDALSLSGEARIVFRGTLAEV